jgi:hypothetical protein
MTQGNVALIAPLVVIEAVLLIAALYDLTRRERVRGGNKWLWAIVIVVLGIIGPILYFTLGRQEA